MLAGYSTFPNFPAPFLSTLGAIAMDLGPMFPPFDAYDIPLQFIDLMNSSYDNGTSYNYDTGPVCLSCD